MKIITSIARMSKESQLYCKAGKTIGFVPTMGALHDGHLSLIRRARRDTDVVVVSIFVNPLQFGVKEDFARYPRALRTDARLCRKEGVDILFCPEAQSMYPLGFRTHVTVDGLSDVLCGRFRPGHFDGVATVVQKLFNIVQPDVAYFGQKDAQQAIIIKRMIDDLNIPVRIYVAPTLREKSGLALSSRNVYLSATEKQDAAVLYQALKLAVRLIKSGETHSASVIMRMKQLISAKKAIKIQYLSIVDTQDLQPVKRIRGTVLIALAVWLGRTRLIDNSVVYQKGKAWQRN
jgi:pantoate--beta-alanine ligase